MKDLVLELLDHLAVGQRGDSLVLEDLEPTITGSSVKACSEAATRGAEASRRGRRGGDVQWRWASRRFGHSLSR